MREIPKLVAKKFNFPHENNWIGFYLNKTDNLFFIVSSGYFVEAVGDDWKIQQHNANADK